MLRDSQLVFGRFEWRPAERRLLVDGQPAPLRARAVDVLDTLIRHRDRIVTKNELLGIVWTGLVVEENNLQVHVSALRKVLGADNISTIPGRGYRFTPRSMVRTLLTRLQAPPRRHPLTPETYLLN